MEDNYKNILSETSFVLKHLEKNLYNKIPANIIETIEKNKNHNYTELFQMGMEEGSKFLKEMTMSSAAITEIVIPEKNKNKKSA